MQAKVVPTGPMDGGFTPATGDVRRMAAALADGNAVDHASREQLKAVQNAVWSLVNRELGDTLPESFVDALLHGVNKDEQRATETLVVKLAAASRVIRQRAPSIDLTGEVGEQFLRRLYAGDDAILARVREAVTQDAFPADARAALAPYLENASVVASLGEQVAFLDIWAPDKGAPWAPHVISNTDEASDALRVYYGAVKNVPASHTAEQTCFTILPAAATKIELGPTINPLAPAVCARLLGCDPDTDGPTYAELFYMARARNMVTTSVEGSGPTQEFVTRLAGAATNVRLVSRPLGGLADPEGFGAARESIVDFDAFVEFLRCDGRPIAVGDSPKVTRTSGTTVFAEEWSRSREQLISLQREVVHAWYDGSLGADGEEWWSEVEKDLGRMPTSGYQDDWRRAMHHLIRGDERRRIRARYLQ